ncbi:MAG: phosphatidylglycerol lysyltransferase domain-containing protein [Candidatus Methylacidiphilales bacterium]
MDIQQINTINNSNNLIINSDEYELLLNNLDIIPTSDFLPSTINFWNNANQVQIFELENAILLVLFNPPFGDAFSHLLVNNLTHNLVKIAAQKTKELNISKLKISYSQSDCKLDFINNLLPETDEFEYIYNLIDLAQLQGSKYKKQRNAFAKALKDNNELSIEISDLAQLENKEEAKQFCKDCMQIKSDRNHSDEPNLQREWLAFQKCIDLNNDLNLKIMKLYANKKLSGLLIYEEFNNEWIVGHFFKTYLGLGMYLLNQLSVALSEQGFKYFNFQEDRGVESLRYFKQQLNPAFQLKTYSIAL